MNPAHASDPAPASRIVEAAAAASWTTTASRSRIGSPLNKVA
jgi:hypothetical protein